MSEWKKYCDENLPNIGQEVIGYNSKWVDLDFNPEGTRLGFVNPDGEFVSLYWWDYQDTYIEISKSICGENREFYINHIDNTEPEYWIEKPCFKMK